MNTSIVQICKGCGLPITGSGEVILTSGYYYHPECTYQIVVSFYKPTSGTEIEQLRARITELERQLIERTSDTAEFFCPKCNVIHMRQSSGLIQHCPECNEAMYFTSLSYRRIKELERQIAESVPRKEREVRPTGK